MEPSSGSCSAGWPDSKGRCGTSSVGAAGMLVANGARAPSSGGGGRGATVGGWSSPREGRRGRGGGSRAAGIGRDPGRERMRILWSLLRGAAPRAGRIRRGGAARRVSEPRGCSLRMARARRGGIPMMKFDRAELGAALEAVGAEGWLLFDFHGLNPVAGRVLGLGGMGTRRIFVLVPKAGEPVAVAHKIELAPL